MAKEGRDEKGRFEKGNLFTISLRNRAKIKSPEIMITLISEYLDYEDSKKRPDQYSKDGKGVYTISGCALYLGFSSRQTWYNYGANEKDGYMDIINRYKLFLTDWNEKKLYWGGTFQGSFVWLKNHGGYSDESTLNQNVTEYKTKWAEDGETKPEKKDKGSKKPESKTDF